MKVLSSYIYMHSLYGAVLTFHPSLTGVTQYIQEFYQYKKKLIKILNTILLTEIYT